MPDRMKEKKEVEVNRKNERRPRIKRPGEKKRKAEKARKTKTGREH